MEYSQHHCKEMKLHYFHKIAPISVVIPCYQCSDTIHRAVESVFAQTFRPAEIILIDDCSGDETLEELFRLRKLYPHDWIKVIALPHNSGPASARNAGWQIATSPYIAFLDADDAWHRQKIELQLGWMLDHPQVALTGHACQVIEPGADVLGNDAIKLQPAEFTRVGRLRQLLSNRFSTRSIILKRNLPYSFAAGKYYAEDYLLWCEISLSGAACCWSNQSLAFLFKAQYGEKGLSAHLWLMEKGELDTYKRLYKAGHYGIAMLLILQFFSLLKFSKRTVQVNLKNIQFCNYSRK